MAHPLLKNLKVPSRTKLIKKIDKVVSHIVRIRDGWRCQRCHKLYTPPTQALHCSHYFSRRYMGTRFDLDNMDAMCYGCHRMIEGDKQGWYKDFKLKQLGKDKFLYLETRAYGITKYGLHDLQMLLHVLDEQLKEIQTH